MNKMIASLLGPLFLGACTSVPAPEQTPLPWDSHVLQGELPNGLQYRLVRDSSQAARLDLRLTVRAGSLDEDDDQVGVAHMLEHLTFRSRAGDQQTLREQMNALGWVQGRNYNAMTNYDRTQYMLSPSGGNNQALLALTKLAQLVFAGDYTAQDLESERPIVVEEWRGGLGVAQRMNDLRTDSQRVGSRYPAHRTIGTESAIRAAQLSQLKRFQQRWYRPNNMILSVVGDFESHAMQQQIQQAFGNAVPQPVPAREQRELVLDRKLKIFRLQDAQTGSNQVSLLFRLHEPDSRGTTLNGIRERLLDRMTLAALLAKLRDQPLQPGVRSLSAQKTLIGKRSSVLGLAAGVDGPAHDAALRELLTELERLRQNGFGEQDLVRERAHIQNLGNAMLTKNQARTFEQWVTALNDAATQDKSVVDSHLLANRYLQALDTIDQADMDARLRLWLASPDRVLQFTAPGDTEIRVPSAAEVQRQQQSIAKTTLPASPPAKARVTTTAPTTFVPVLLEKPGNITAKRSFTQQKVEHWTLGNGDRLVWLRRNADDGRWRMQAESAAGDGVFDGLSWRGQMAAQLGSQSGPQGVPASALSTWRTQQHVPLSLEMNATRLELSVTTKATPEALIAMLQSYRLSQRSVAIEPSLFVDARDDLIKRLEIAPDNIRSRQAAAHRQLRYGNDDWLPPDADQLLSLEADDLTAQWQRMTAAPVTYYLMADVDPHVLEKAVREQLANLPRAASKQTAKLLRSSVQQSGQRSIDLDIALEPRAVLEAHSFSELAWSPHAAAQVAALRNLANQKLKQRLRGEASGVYRLTFDSELNPDSQRIESRLSFTCDPARAEELWTLAQQTLASLDQSVSAAWVAQARADLSSQEGKRIDDPASQWKRLLLSERHWGDPRYLSTQAMLPQAIRIEQLKPLAARLFPAQNQVLLRLLPRPDRSAPLQ